MKKHSISKLFLYRYRYIIGYILLGLYFIGLIVFLPNLSPNGLSTAEMSSVVTSAHTNLSSIVSGNIVDLPYHVLQKYTIQFFGLTTYGIKLPSIIIGLILGFLLILLLNRWFKNNVAIIASIITVLSISFLYLAGSGTPLIMIVFWPTFLLWLGSKIQGVGKPKPLYCFFFAFALLLAIFTPYMLYLAIFIIIYALAHPHLRFTIKTLPKVPLILSGVILTGGLTIFGISTFTHGHTIAQLLFTTDFSLDHFFNHLSTAFLPFFAWSGNIESYFLSPLIGLASLALAITGLISTTKGFFASRNSIATYLIIFTVLISGLNPQCAVLLILPLAILIAHGVRYTLEKWYGLFPENPYARIFGLIPISIFLGIMLTSDLTHFIFGYRYNPPVADNFTTDLTLVQTHLPSGTTFLIPSDSLAHDFYQILSPHQSFTVVSELPTTTPTQLATLGKWEQATPNFRLERIITSSKSSNSDRIYLYVADSSESTEAQPTDSPSN